MITNDEFKILKKKLEKAYQEMMDLHQQNARGFEYANARSFYMEIKAQHDKALAAHPEFKDV